jgi:hypothetical protein
MIYKFNLTALLNSQQAYLGATASGYINFTLDWLTIFFHPDFTVGFGVSPNHAFRLAGCTAGRDFHTALKI